MKNGTYVYEIEMNTPLGKRRGNLELMVWDDFLNGYLTMFTRTIPFKKGTRTGNQITFEGDMKTLMKMIPYKASGSLSGSSVVLEIATEQGVYPASGILASTRGVDENGGT